MRIKADELTINKIFEGNEDIFRVPNYQRRYSWDKDQWSDLWNDLVSLSGDETHFLGSVVVISRQHDPASFNELELVDGQQRLTTLSIIFCAIRDYFKENGEDRVANEIERVYLYSKRFEKENLKVKLGNLDSDNFENLVKGDIDKISKNSLIKKSYQYFLKKVKEMDHEEVKDLRNKLIGNLLLVLITTDSDRSAFRLFETLNDRGLELSAIDLMKNYLLRVSAEKENVDIDEIKEMWEDIVLNLEDVDRKIRFFRHHFMSSKRPETRVKITQGKVYDKFKNIIEKELSKEDLSIKEYIGEMKNKSSLYADICEAEVSKFENHKDNEINKYLRNLNDIGAIPSRTLILRSFSELSENIEHNELIEILKLVEIFSVRRAIGRMSTGELDTIYNQIAVTAFSEAEPLLFIKDKFISNITSNEEFRKNFMDRSYRSNDFTKYILDTIERKHFMKMGKGKEIANRHEVHIEHIAPKASFSAKKYNSWEDYLRVSEEEFDEIKNNIGNLTLFERKLNIEASDKPFEQKKEKYEEKTDFIMTEKICDFEDWGINQINKRTEELADIALKIWDIGSYKNY